MNSRSRARTVIIGVLWTSHLDQKIKPNNTVDLLEGALDLWTTEEVHMYLGKSNLIKPTRRQTTCAARNLQIQIQKYLFHFAWTIQSGSHIDYEPIVDG